MIIHFPLWAYSFLTLHEIAFMCISNFKDVSNIKLNCSFDETCGTGLSLKKIGEGTFFFIFQVKILVLV